MEQKEKKRRVTFFVEKKVFEEVKCENVSVHLMKPEMMFYHKFWKVLERNSTKFIWEEKSLDARKRKKTSTF